MTPPASLEVVNIATEQSENNRIPAHQNTTGGSRHFWLVVGLTAFTGIGIGFFLGREHLKFEIRSALAEAGNALSESQRKSFDALKQTRAESAFGGSDDPQVKSHARVVTAPELRPAEGDVKIESKAIAASEPSPAQGGVKSESGKINPKEPLLPEIVEFGQSVAIADLRVSLEEARVLRPEVKTLFGDTKRGQDPTLKLVLRIKNLHERKILNFREANVFLAGHFKLRDDVDNVIRGVDYGAGSHPVGALTSEDDILPGEEATHVVLFTVPPPKTKFLVLTMDLAALRLEGQTRFRIPVEEIAGFPR